MKTNMDMNHTHGEAMDGVSDPFSRDTAGLPEEIAPDIVVLPPDDDALVELRAKTHAHRQDYRQREARPDHAQPSLILLLSHGLCVHLGLVLEMVLSRKSDLAAVEK